MARDIYKYHSEIEKPMLKFQEGRQSYTYEKKTRVFMRSTSYDGPEFLTPAHEWNRDPEEAKDYSKYGANDLAHTYSNFAKENEYAYFAFIDLTIKHQFDAVPMDSEEMIDAIREQAVRKLSRVEIEALGAEPIAIYYKLKNHNVDEDENER